MTCGVRWLDERSSFSHQCMCNGVNGSASAAENAIIIAICSLLLNTNVHLFTSFWQRVVCHSIVYLFSQKMSFFHLTLANSNKLFLQQINLFLLIFKLLRTLNWSYGEIFHSRCRKIYEILEWLGLIGLGRMVRSQELEVASGENWEMWKPNRPMWK